MKIHVEDFNVTKSVYKFIIIQIFIIPSMCTLEYRNACAYFVVPAVWDGRRIH